MYQLFLILLGTDQNLGLGVEFFTHSPKIVDPPNILWPDLDTSIVIFNPLYGNSLV